MASLTVPMRRSPWSELVTETASPPEDHGSRDRVDASSAVPPIGRVIICAPIAATAPAKPLPLDSKAGWRAEHVSER